MPLQKLLRITGRSRRAANAFIQLGQRPPARQDMRVTSATQARADAILSGSLGRMGSLETRLARTDQDIRAAQSLRYDVFYGEMAARSNTARLLRRDVDQYDALCDHVLVIDHDAPIINGRPRVVGTYRLLRQDIAERHDGFYTASEYDIGPMLTANPDICFVELGRSCVLKPYRNRRTLELLWSGVWTYIRAHHLGAMFGCASFPGTNPEDHALALSFLHHFGRAEGGWSTRALDTHHVSMDMIPKHRIAQKAAIRLLPPLIKGYLKLGARFGDGAVIDPKFGTVDVCAILPKDAIQQRYLAHFGAPDALEAVNPGTDSVQPDRAA